MTKLVAFAAAFSLAAASLATPTIASAAPGGGNNQVSQVCNAGLAALLGVSTGNCISLLNGAPGDSIANANALCNLWQGPFGIHFFGQPYPFATQGQCVSTLNAFFGKS